MKRLGYKEINAAITRMGLAEAETLFLSDSFSMFCAQYRVGEMLNLHTPYVLEEMRVLLVMRGHACLEVDLQTVELHEGMVVVVSNGCIMQVKSVSEDYIVKGMIMRTSVVSSLFTDRVYYFLQSEARAWAFELSPEDRALMSHMQECLLSVSKKYGFVRSVAWPQLKAVLGLVEQAYLSVHSKDDERYDNDIFHRFLQLVALHAAEHHGLDFYSNALCITPNYLSAVVKQSSGMTAKQWIDKAIVTKAQIMLNTGNMQAAQVSAALHFPNPSFFNKFFKRLTGTTPGDYRPTP